MAKTPLGGRSGNGTARQRSVVAAAVRAAAKRSERSERSGRGRKAGRAGRARAEEAPAVVSGRTVVVDKRPRALEPPETMTGASGASGASGDGTSGAEEPGADKAERSEPAPARKRRLRLPPPVLPSQLRVLTGRVRVLLALITLLAVAATALLAWQYREAERTRQARTDAVAAARQAAPEILSYDHRHLERDFQAARAHLTGSFRKDFEKTTTSVVSPTAKKYDGVVRATVAEPPSGDQPAVSVVSASPSEVQVLLFMNQVTESKKVAEPRLDLNRVRMTLTDTDDGWKVSALDAL